MIVTSFHRAVAVTALAVLALGGCGGGAKNTNNAPNTTAGHPNNYSPTSSHNAPMGDSGLATINCGAVQPVWVNTKSKAYHEQGDPLYGHTKHGKYMCPSAATAAGYHLARGSRDSGSMNGGGRKHHRRSSNYDNGGAMATPTP